MRKEDAVALLHEDRLFPAEETTRAIARRLYDGIKDLPIVSPHGHTQAGWFARNEPFPDPVTLLVQPDHYIFRMLYSQGISLEELEIGKTAGEGARARCGAFSRATITCFAERLRGFGWIMFSRNCSD